MQTKPFRAFLPFALTATVTSAQQWPAWTRLTTPTLPLLEYQYVPQDFALARDEARNQPVLFGATRAPGSASETWEWNRTTWCRCITAHTPPRRTHAALAFDPVRGQLLLFGGYGALPLGDTWAYDGDDWTELMPVNAPPGRGQHAMATDFARGRIVMHGGRTVWIFGQILNDTWEWDGNDWRDVTPAQPPPSPVEPSLAWNGVTRRVAFVNVDDRVREWDGMDWQVITPSTPLPARMEATIASDPAGRGVLLYGGAVGFFSPVREAWRWDGTAWTRLADLPFETITGRTAAAIDRRSLVHYGTYSGTHDTWRYDSGTDAWHLAASARGNASWHTATPTLDGLGLLMVDHATWYVDGEGVHPWPGSPQTPSLIRTIVADPTSGTYLGVTYNGACHRFDGTRWTSAPAFPGLGPSLAGFDASRQQILAVGYTTLDDLRLWGCDANGWSLLTLLPSTGSQADAAIDAVRGVVVVHGPDATYEYDAAGTVSSIPAPGNVYGRLLPHPIGGVALFSRFGSYRWDGARWHPIAAIEEPDGCDTTRQRCWMRGVIEPTFVHPFAVAATDHAPRLGTSIGLGVHAPEGAGRHHLLFLAFANDPGIGIPWPRPIRLPLANDALFAASLTLGRGGTLDANGRASHLLTIPPVRELAGLQCHAAALLLPSGSEPAWVSNAARICVRP